MLLVRANMVANEACFGLGMIIPSLKAMSGPKTWCDGFVEIPRNNVAGKIP
jgi:hypothetical protein